MTSRSDQILSECKTMCFEYVHIRLNVERPFCYKNKLKIYTYEDMKDFWRIREEILTHTFMINF